MIELVYNNLTEELNTPKSLSANKDGKFFDHHFQSTTGDNLTELSGRICYDSCVMEKSRNSVDYHKHINEVKHTSVQGHFNQVVEIQTINNQINDFILWSCLDRPGVYVSLNPQNNNVRISSNLRSANEWSKFNNRIISPDIQNDLGAAIQSLFKQKCPLTLSHLNIQESNFIGKIVLPIWPEEKWLTFYINNVSRGLSHELVRHGYMTGISQRSTRYVDESESNWIYHPLEQKYKDYMPINEITEHENTSKQLYFNIQSKLEKCLIDNGIDKFSARKQSRGAARGHLGNALSTELIWSSSLSEIKEIIRQRASDGADAEIRLFGDQLYEIANKCYPEEFTDYKTKPSPDGIGYSISV